MTGWQVLGQSEVQREERERGKERTRKETGTVSQRGRRGKRRRQMGRRKEETEEERRVLTLVWRTGYYTFLKTHIHHAGAHHLNEVILAFLIRLTINYLYVNCFAVNGKIRIISKE